jgi:AcrR family transcriptional regulator
MGEGRNVGRPRDPGVEHAVLTATRRALAIDGYARMTMAGIAREAGVTKPTIYLRWRTKHDLVIATLEYTLRLSEEREPELGPGTMPTRDVLIRALIRYAPSSDLAQMLLGHIVAESTHQPELFEIVRKHSAWPRHEGVLAALRTAVRAGELPVDTDLDTVADMLLGAYQTHYLRTGEVGPELAAQLVDTLLPTLTKQ